MVTRAAGSLANHEASKTHLLLALECLEPTVFDWCTAVTNNMKRQLSNCRRGETKQFGYGSILVPLILERVPAMRLQTMAVDPPGSSGDEGQSMGSHHATWGWRPPHSWGAFFRDWLDQQEIFVEDWPYAGMDFRNDPDMPLPPGEQWDDAGMTLCLFEFFNVFDFFMYMS
jgi:hypothetical protein